MEPTSKNARSPATFTMAELLIDCEEDRARRPHREVARAEETTT